MRAAVILSHNRPELLLETWSAIGPQVDVVIVIDNASDPPVDRTALWATGEDCWLTSVVAIPDQPPNLSRLWNLGIERALRLCSPVMPMVAVLCDDAPPPPGWFATVTEAMVATGAAVGCSAPEGFTFREPYRVKTESDSDIAGRMPGWAWILNPDSGVRADEQFEYWWGDTDLDRSARMAGGMVMIGSHAVPNRLPDGHTGRMAAQIAVDSQRFVAKYGSRPW